MARSAKTAHPTAQVWALPLADAANASEATATITVSASSAKAGTIALVVAGQRVAVGVKASERATAIATAIKTALQQHYTLPFQNPPRLLQRIALDLVHERLHDGVYNALKIDAPKSALIPRKKGGLALATEWIEGADTPNRFDKSQSSRYLAALPYSDSAAVSALETVLQERWEPTVAKEGEAFIPAVGTLSQMTALGGTYNSHLLCLVGVGKR